MLAQQYHQIRYWNVSKLHWIASLQSDVPKYFVLAYYGTNHPSGTSAEILSPECLHFSLNKRKLDRSVGCHDGVEDRLNGFTMVLHLKCTQDLQRNISRSQNPSDRRQLHIDLTWKCRIDVYSMSIRGFKPSDRRQLDIDPTHTCRIDVWSTSIRESLLSGKRCTAIWRKC